MWLTTVCPKLTALASTLVSSGLKSAVNFGRDDVSAVSVHLNVPLLSGLLPVRSGGSVAPAPVPCLSVTVDLSATGSGAAARPGNAAASLALSAWLPVPVAKYVGSCCRSAGSPATTARICGTLCRSSCSTSVRLPGASPASPAAASASVDELPASLPLRPSDCISPSYECTADCQAPLPESNRWWSRLFAAESLVVTVSW